MKGIINAFGKIKTTTVLMTIAAICAVLLVALGVSELVKTKPEQDNSGSAEQEITAQEDMDDSGYFEGIIQMEFWDDGFDEEEYADAPDDYSEYDSEITDIEMSEYGFSEYDEAGNGVYIVEDEEGLGMHHHWYRFAYTNDSGKSWTPVKGYLDMSAYFNDVRVSGNHVVMCVTNYVDFDGYVFYSDDMCQTVYGVCIQANLPEYKDLLRSRVNLIKILDINKTDGSVILAFYDTEEEYSYCSLDEYIGGSDEKTYLIVKADSTFQHFDVLYADDEYIEKTAWKWDE